MITLYQFPISHFCEKVRWALAYKKLDYKIVNLLPGFHAKKMMELVGKHSVPVLVDGEKAIAESSAIISHLDNKYPEHQLTPTHSTLKEEAMEWENFADKEIGVHVRRIAYHTLLEHPEIVIKFFTQGGPWYGRFLIKMIFPKLRKKMRYLMDINDESVKKSKIGFEEALKRVCTRLENNQFLVGKQFSRADLAVASLMAPLCSPQEYGLDWPSIYPESLQAYIDQHETQLQWVKKTYKSFR